MKIDGTLLKSERENRAWSQDHLASAAGLGVRTVQRIEKTGTASYQSVQSLAAALSLDCKELIIKRREQQKRPVITQTRSVLSAAATIGAFVFLGVLAARSSFADQVMLDFGITENNGEISRGQLLTEEGKVAEVMIEETLRLKLTPTIEDDGKIFLSASIYMFQDGSYFLVSEPKLITANNKEATIRISFDDSTEYIIVVTPHAN